MTLMKNRKTSLIIFIIVISLIFFIPSGQCEETDDTEEIAHFSSIQEAINNASEGDTVYIYAGDYYEDILINKSVIIEGKTVGELHPVVFGNVTIVSNNVTISNLCIQNGSGIKVTGYLGSLGIEIYNNITIKNNVIKNNLDYGITIRFSYDIKIIDNIFEKNNGGVYFYYVNNSVIQNNTFEKNQDYAINFGEPQSSNYNMIYHNSFTNNTENVYDGGINFWNTSKEGNYWDDYTGIDRNPQNGIGDTPYNINGGSNQDKYPLMKPYEGRITIDKYVVNRGTVQNMLIIGIILAILFCLPIGLWWRKKYFK